MAYASRVMCEAEHQYAQMEEVLAATWACKKFSLYLLGLSFTTEKDHKPLVPLKSLSAPCSMNRSISFESFMLLLCSS